MKKEDYSWCFDGNAIRKLQFINPSACTGFDVCGSDGCEYEVCGFDCGKDCYDDYCEDCWNDGCGMNCYSD